MKTTNVVALYSVGWTISYQSLRYGLLCDRRFLPDVVPFLGMDGWNSAYVLDYKPVDSLDYIDAFFSSTNWDTLDKRLVV